MSLPASGPHQPKLQRLGLLLLEALERGDQFQICLVAGLAGGGLAPKEVAQSAGVDAEAFLAAIAA